MKALRVALAQSHSSVGTETYDPRDDNLERAVVLLQRAAKERAQLAVFGEMYLTGYRTDEHLWRYATAVEPPDHHLEVLLEVARDVNVHVIIGAATSGPFLPGDVYNSALFIGPAGLIGVYRKTHLAAFYYRNTLAMERTFYSPGQELPVFDSALGTIGIHICNDINFPEVSRVQALKGAEVLVNVSASAVGMEEQWEHLLFARAVENATWYVVCSVVGEQRGDVLFGGSRVIDPFGTVVAAATDHAEDFVIATLDSNVARRTRASSHVFSSRRPA